MKNIMITGCAGFIGSHVAEVFLTDPIYRVFGVDNLTYAGNVDNMKSFLKNKNFTFFRENICNQDLIEKLCKENKITEILNLAAETHVDNSIKECYSFVDSNIKGVVSILEVCKNSNIKLLHFSTDEVYGAKLKGKYTELDPLSPRNPYSATKAAADCLIKSYENTHKVKSILVRPSNNYGPRQHTEKFLPTIVKSIRRGEKIPIYGSGKQIREWTYVKDTAKAVKFILEKGSFGETYNISSSCEVENLCLVKKILATLGKEVKDNIIFVPDRKGHDFRYSICNKKLISAGFNDYTSFKSGLRETLHYYLNEL